MGVDEVEVKVERGAEKRERCEQDGGVETYLLYLALGWNLAKR